MRALGDVLAEGRAITRDLGGTASTIEFTDAVSRRLA
jgi:isocitrate/isopropylmalate dehydrogenase